MYGNTALFPPSGNYSLFLLQNVITLYMFVTETIIAVGGGAHFSLYLGLPLIPLILVFLSIPAMFIVELTWNHRKKIILKAARKLGAMEISEIEVKGSLP